MRKIEGFEHSRDILKREQNRKIGIVAAVDGFEKAGKTHFSLTSAPPIAVFDFDHRLRGVIDKFPKKDIWVSNYSFANKPIQADCADLWTKFVREYGLVVESSDFRTLVVDTATELWEILRIARFGKVAEVKPHHYGPVNAAMRKLVRQAVESDKNVLFIHKLSRNYVDDRWDGTYGRAGFKDMGYLVEVNLRITFDKQKQVHKCLVEDCGYDSTLTGLEFEGEACTFPYVASAIRQDWEDRQ